MPLACLASRTLADTPLLHGCWLINIRDSVFSFISLNCRTNHFIPNCFSPKFFYSSPPGSCHPLVTFFTLSTFLTSFSQLVSLPACSLCCLCCSVVVRVSWTDGLCGHSFALLTHSQHRTRTQAIKHVCGGFPPDKARKPRERLCFSPPTPPCPRWGRDHKPNNSFTLVV